MNASQPQRLSGKRAVVTAAGQGIGRAIAIRFAAEGARVLAIDVDAKALDHLPDERMETACADASSEAAMAPLLERFRPGVLANCVGWVRQGTVLECSPDDWRRAFALNVDSIYVAVRVVLPMKDSTRSAAVSARDRLFADTRRERA